MKWPPTGNSSQVLIINPCFTEQGIGRTSMILSGPIKFSVCMVVFMFDGFVFMLKTSHAGCGAAEFSHHRRIPRRIPNHFDLETIQAAVARPVLIAGIAASGSEGL